MIHLMKTEQLLMDNVDIHELRPKMLAASMIGPRTVTGDACRDTGPSSPRRGDDLAEFRLTPTE